MYTRKRLTVAGLAGACALAITAAFAMPAFAEGEPDTATTEQVVVEQVVVEITEPEVIEEVVEEVVETPEETVPEATQPQSLRVNTPQGGNPPDNENNGECPAGYIKVADDYTDGMSWTADDDYDSVILVGGPAGDTNQDPDGRDKYFTDVEEGDVISREAHDISHICGILTEDEPSEGSITVDECAVEDRAADIHVEVGSSEGSIKVTVNDVLFGEGVAKVDAFGEYDVSVPLEEDAYGGSVVIKVYDGETLLDEETVDTDCETPEEPTSSTGDITVDECSIEDRAADIHVEVGSSEGSIKVTVNGVLFGEGVAKVDAFGEYDVSVPLPEDSYEGSVVIRVYDGEVLLDEVTVDTDCITPEDPTEVNPALPTLTCTGEFVWPDGVTEDDNPASVGIYESDSAYYVVNTTEEGEFVSLVVIPKDGVVFGDSEFLQEDGTLLIESLADLDRATCPTEEPEEPGTLALTGDDVAGIALVALLLGGLGLALVKLGVLRNRRREVTIGE